MVFEIEVILNWELQRELLGFGDFIKVLSPPSLAGFIKSRLKKAYDLYTDDIC